MVASPPASRRWRLSGPKHLAVLPFVNIGDDPANRLTSDGLLETLTGRLSDLDSSGKILWVVPADEVRQRKVTEPGDAVKQLGVRFVVTGSVQREAKGVRLTVNLVDARDMRRIGSAAISESDGDYSALEAGAVQKLAELLRVDTQTIDSARQSRPNPAVYQEYLEAMGYLHRWDQQGNLEKAIDLFEKVTEQDPQVPFGPGWPVGSLPVALRARPQSKMGGPGAGGSQPRPGSRFQARSRLRHARTDSQQHGAL